jgi:predicted  nucleic acid-binding Zn-ribbon protein
MSMAVRVSVWVLGVLVVISAAVAVLALMQKQTLQGQNQNLRSQISDDEAKLTGLTARAKKLEDDAVTLNNKISQTQQEKAQAQSLYDDLKHKSDDLQAQIDQANSDRDDWKNRFETISHDRDDLMQKLKNRPVQIVYKDRIVKVPAPAAAEEDNSSAPPPAAAPVVDVTSGQGDQYWAEVLKQKAALQVELEKEKSELDQAALQVVDLKKQNSDLQVEVKQISNEKDEIVQKIKYGQDLADNLSIDLARSRDDQQAVNDRADKLKTENLGLMSQIRDLSSAKLDLERTVSRLTDDKDAMQKKLIETESVIQSRIDDIWKIKEGLDKKLSENAPSSSTPGSMELPPIIVNAPSNNSNQQQQAVAPAPESNPAMANAGKNEGQIISINESNNFVIVDLGQENSSVSVGNPLKVYRNSNEIATLEVIQVRRDICAADIKDKSDELKVGDIVKFN